MRKLLLILSFLLIGLSSFSQKKIPEFGKADIAELALTACPFEKDAAAMKLFDLQEIVYTSTLYESKLKTERRVRIKVFNSKGYKFASINIPYVSKDKLMKIDDLRGVVYNLDETGKVVVSKLEKKDFFRTQAEENIGMISFTFPNLKPGSVIEYSYTRTDKENNFLDPWIIQGEIPVAYASLNLTMPERARLVEKIYGADSLQKSSEPAGREQIKNVYYKENIPSFTEEPFMSSLTDNLLRITFQFYPYGSILIDSLSSAEKIWKVTNLTLLENEWFGGQLKSTIPGTSGLIDSARKLASVEKRIEFLFEEVKKRLAGDVKQTMRAYDLTEAWRSKQANTAEINLILVNLLQKADVTSYPLLISTRNHGKINVDIPGIRQFNGIDVLALDSNRSYVLDASIKEQSYLNPPFNIMNRIALIVHPEAVNWVSINDERPLMRQETVINASLGDDGCAQGMANVRLFDFAKVFSSDSLLEERNELETLVEKAEDVTVHFAEIQESKSYADPVMQQIAFTYVPANTADYYRFKPLFLFAERQNPFTNNWRNTDIDMGCNQQISFSLSLRIPASFEIEFLPKSTVLRTPDTSFIYKRICSRDSVQVSLHQTFEVRRSLFDKEEYFGIQEFFKRVYALMADEIVLKKKK